MSKVFDVTILPKGSGKAYKMEVYADDNHHAERRARWRADADHGKNGYQLFIPINGREQHKPR